MGLLDTLVDPRIAGEFSPNEQNRQQAKSQALMMAGLGMLGQRSLGQAVANGGMAGLQSYQQALDNSRRAKMQQFETGMTLQGLLEKQKQRKALEEAMANASPEERQAMQMGVSPTEIWKRKNPEDQYKVVGNSMVQVGGGKVNPVFTAPDKSQALPWYVRRDPTGGTSIDPAYAEFEKMKAREGKPASPYFTPVPTVNGLGRFDNRTGRFELVDGGGVVKPSDSPSLQGEIAGAKEGAKVTAKTQTEAAFDAPRVVQVAETAIRHVDDLLSHPGFGQAVGKSSMLGVQKIPGMQAYDFMNRLDQVKGGAFLEAFNQLKGGGQITEVEGKKATDALARMNNSTSEQEFKAAADDFKATVQLGMNRAKMKAGNRQPQSQPQPAVSGGVKFLGFE